MALRPGYKDSEIGPIPDDWDAVPLGELGEALIGLTYTPSDVSNDGTLVLRSSNIQNDALAFTDNVFVACPIPEKIMVRPGDVLICVRNGSADLIGKTVLLDDRVIGMTFGAFMAVFRSEIGPLVNYCFQSPILKRQINEHLGATINQITNKSLNSFKISLPRNRDEQRAIAEALSDVDAAIDAMTRLLAKKRDLRTSAMQRLLTGETRLPGFSEPWQDKAVGDLVDTDPENLGVDTPADLRFNYIALEGVSHGRLMSWSEQLFGSAPSRARRKLRQGDVLLATVRPNLKAHLLFDKETEAAHWVCSTGFCVLRCKDGLAHPGYVFAQLFGPSIPLQIEKLIAGSNYPAINSRDVRHLVIGAPRIEEQVAISEVLSDMEAEIAALSDRLAKTTALKQAMMQALLTGRVRLPVADVERAHKEPAHA